MKPQYIRKDAGGTFYYSDKKMTKLHREDGPACEWADGTKFWYLNGERHREDGPAIDDPYGSKYWYYHNELHREDGPAIEWADGSKEWCLNGEYLSEQGHTLRTKKVRTIEINGKRFTVDELNALIARA